MGNGQGNWNRNREGMEIIVSATDVLPDVVTLTL